MLGNRGSDPPVVAPSPPDQVAPPGVALVSRPAVVDEQLGAAAEEVDLELGAGVVAPHQPHEVCVGDPGAGEGLEAAEKVDKEVAEVVGDHGGEVELQPVKTLWLRRLLVLAAVAPGDVCL